MYAYATRPGGRRVAAPAPPRRFPETLSPANTFVLIWPAMAPVRSRGSSNVVYTQDMLFVVVYIQVLISKLEARASYLPAKARAR